jgi:hypothetical protein
VRQILIGCLLTALVATFALVGGGAIYYYLLRDFSDFFYPDYETPDPGVQVGAGQFISTPYPASSDLLTVTSIVYEELDGEPGNEWALTDGIGIQFLDATGNPGDYVALEGSNRSADFVFIEAEQSWFVYSSSNWAEDEDVILFNLDGSRHWVIESDAPYTSMIDGDADGDGEKEFLVLEFYGEETPATVSLYDRQKNLQWTREIETLYGAGLEDLDGDGLDEILTVEDTNMVLRDASGEIRNEFLLQTHINQAWGVTWPLAGDRKSLITDGNERFVLIDHEARPALELAATGLWYPSHLRAESIQFDAGGPSYLAVLAGYEYEDYARLYIYDENNELVYYEIIGEHCASLHVAKEPGQTTARLAVGGYARIITYAPGSPEQSP